MLELTYMEKELEGRRVFMLPIQIDELPGAIAFVSFDDNSVKIYVHLARNVSGRRRYAVLELLNGLNERFRFMYFYMDDDGDVFADIDLILYSEDGSGKHVAGMLTLLSRALDKCAADVMRAVWGDGMPHRLAGGSDAPAGSILDETTL